MISFIFPGTYQKYVIRNIRRGTTDRLHHCATVTGVVQFQFITAFNTGELVNTLLEGLSPLSMSRYLPNPNSLKSVIKIKSF